LPPPAPGSSAQRPLEPNPLLTPPPLERADETEIGAPHSPTDDDDDAPARVRAYSWTRGRTQSQVTLEIETLLTTSARYQESDEWTQGEYHTVAALCRQPRSVAEVAALLSVPLGVAKVLLGDMAENGLLVVHETASAGEEGRPDLAMMERILTGLRRL
jgi:hypothetical protein